MPAKLNPFTCKPDLVLGPGSGTATVQFDIDANTAPGTDPTLPTGAGAVTISGSAVAAHSVPVETHARAANAFNIEVQVGAAVTGAPGNTDAAGLVQFDDTSFSVDADGYVTLVGGGMAIDSFTTDTSGPVGPDGAGNVDVTGTSVFSDGSVANTLTLNVQATANTFLVGAGAGSTATELGPLTNGQLIIGSTGVAPVLGSLASADGSITITPGAGTIDLAIAAADDAVLTITGDSGGALSPAAGNINILGGSNGIDTSGAGSTLTLNFDVTEQPAIATSVSTDSGTATPAANVLTVAGGTGVNTSGSGSTVTVNIDSPVTVANGGTGATTLTDGGILLGSGTSAITATAQPTNGQLLVGSTGVDPVLATLTEGEAIDITNGAGSITLACETATDTNLGVATFDENDFLVTSGDVTFAARTRQKVACQGGYVENLGISYSGSVLSVTGADGTALSSTNPGYVVMQDKSSPGQLKTYEITADQGFIDATGSSEIAGNLWGMATGVATSTDIPFFIYAVTNDDEDAIAFMISRVPGFKESVGASDIGDPGDPVADNQWGFFSFDTVTEADYDNNPCLMIGGFRMKMDASDDWTVQALGATDGIGCFQNHRWWLVPPGQFGAASGSFFRDNGGTAPVFTTQNYYYKIYPFEQTAYVAIDFINVSTQGVGAVTAKLVSPFYIPPASGSSFPNSKAQGTFIDASASNARNYISTEGGNVDLANMYLEGGTGPIQNQDFDTNDDLRINTMIAIKKGT